MGYSRKTIDCYKICINKGNGWRAEAVEYTKTNMIAKLAEYKANTEYPVKMLPGRQPITSENEKFLGMFEE